MDKFRLLYEHLLSSGTVSAQRVHTPRPAERELLVAAHEAGYVDGVLERRLDEKAMRRIGFPLTDGVVMRSRGAVAGTLLTARLALEHGIACNTAGGSHHAFASHGSGYCVFNDVAVAARALLDDGTVRQVLVIDLDVHQGDGTAAICAADPRIFTFSMHCGRNFPTVKQQSDRDVVLDPGTGDRDYLDILSRELRVLLPQVAPDLVFYNAGVDPHEADRLGRLSLTDSGLEAREQLVLAACRQGGVPVAGVLGGGYAPDVGALVARHALLFRAAQSVLAG